MKKLLKKGGKIDKLESNKQGDNLAGCSIQKEGEVDPNFIVRRIASMQFWDLIFTLRSKVPLVTLVSSRKWARV